MAPKYAMAHAGTGTYQNYPRLFVARGGGQEPYGLGGTPLAFCRTPKGARGVAGSGMGLLRMLQARMPGLLDLAEGPYLLIAMYLDAAGLCQVDATCRVLRELDRAQTGPWFALGSRTFWGLELEGDGVFEPTEPAGGHLCTGGVHHRKHSRVDWKGRWARFRSEAPTFRDPFRGANITEVEQADEIAYSRCTLRTDLLCQVPHADVYLEICVLSNPDNVSLAVVDFEAGGCSSVTFSPDTGAVIRERKVCELPRKVQGAYIQPLSTITPGRGFEGSMGIFLHAGHLAFFRRHAMPAEAGQELELGPWESTGFVTDLSWAEGRRLTPCLAFRNEGKYQVRIVCVSSKPPLMPEKSVLAYDEANWSSLNWDADQELPDE